MYLYLLNHHSCNLLSVRGLLKLSSTTLHEGLNNLEDWAQAGKQRPLHLHRTVASIFLE